MRGYRWNGALLVLSVGAGCIAPAGSGNGGTDAGRAWELVDGSLDANATTDAATDAGSRRIAHDASAQLDAAMVHAPGSRDASTIHADGGNTAPNGGAMLDAGAGLDATPSHHTHDASSPQPLEGGAQAATDASSPTPLDATTPDATTTPLPSVGDAGHDSAVAYATSLTFEGSCADAGAELLSNGPLPVPGTLTTTLHADATSTLSASCAGSTYAVQVVPFELTQAADMTYDINRVDVYAGVTAIATRSSLCDGPVDWCLNEPDLGDAIRIETLQPGSYYLAVGTALASPTCDVNVAIRTAVPKPLETNVTCDAATPIYFFDAVESQLRAGTEHFYRLDVSNPTAVNIVATLRDANLDSPDFHLDIFTNCPTTTPIASAMSAALYGQANVYYGTQSGPGPLSPGTYWIRFSAQLGTSYRLSLNSVQ